MFKYKMNLLFLFIISICTLTFVSADELCLLGKTIYIDPGHGGFDPGAVYKDIRESDINLSLGIFLKDELEKNGATVYLTRIGDYDLSKNNVVNRKKNDLSARAKLINDSNCDMFISIHLNSDPSPTWYGTQFFYTDKNSDNEKIADIMQKLFKEKLNAGRDVKKMKNMYLFDKISRPGILIEAGFISNQNDRYLLLQDDYQKKLVKVMTEGVIEYFNNML